MDTRFGAIKTDVVSSTQYFGTTVVEQPQSCFVSCGGFEDVSPLDRVYYDSFDEIFRHGVRAFPCKFCDHTFPSTYDAMEHLYNVHFRAKQDRCGNCYELIRPLTISEHHYRSCKNVQCPNEWCLASGLTSEQALFHFNIHKNFGIIKDALIEQLSVLPDLDGSGTKMDFLLQAASAFFGSGLDPSRRDYFNVLSRMIPRTAGQLRIRFGPGDVTYPSPVVPSQPHDGVERRISLPSSNIIVLSDSEDDSD